MLCAGIDEAGRGCLAGPVVAAAVILPADFDLPGLADSKQISAKKRSELEIRIKAVALAHGLGVVWPKTIDRVNILQATFMAMSRAVSRLKTTPEILLVDGTQTIPERYLAGSLAAKTLPAQRAIVHGDALEAAISAASILAKTFRDKIMTALERAFPNYGFARHKGYGTKAHFAALRELGPCPMHRKSFRGVLSHPERAQSSLWQK